MECCICKHMKGFENSNGDWIDFCTNTESGAYLNETGVCGSCELEYEDEEHAKPDQE